MHLCKFQKSSWYYRPFVGLVLARTMRFPHWNISPRHWWSWIIQQSNLTCIRVLGGIFFYFMSAAVIFPYRSIRCFIMYFFDDPIHPVTTLIRVNMYVMSTVPSKIFISSVSMLWWLAYMKWAPACSSQSFDQTSVVACTRTWSIPHSFTGAF